MKTQAEIEARLNELKSDERLTYPAATVFANAPLALHQTAAESQIHALEFVLALPYSKFPLPKKAPAKTSKSK